MVLEKAEELFKNLRYLKLYLVLSNKVTGQALFWIKLAFLTVAIGGGYSAVKIIDRNPIFAIFYISIALFATILFVYIFQCTYKATEKCGRIKTILELKSASFSRNDQKYFRCILESIRGLKINVGHFHRVERVKTYSYI